MKVRLKIFFSYDGTSYYGFQRQHNAQTTIQAALERVLSRLSSHRVSLLASGRTDAGVHARIQVAHCDVPAQVVQRYDLERLEQSANAMLPRDIRIFRIEITSPKFHAIRDVKKKTYLYFIDPSPICVPELKNYVWSLRIPLNWAAIEKATAYLEGTHDFTAFCSSGSSVKTTKRTIYEARWGKIDGFGFHSSSLVALRITGSGFLKHMVRTIVGTLVFIGQGRGKPELINKALSDKKRSTTGPTAPPQGLWLWDILY